MDADFSPTFINLNHSLACMAHQEVILTFAAHNDDQIIGVGGTLVKYVREGKKVMTYVFSYGDMSHPWLKRRIIKNMRVRESKQAKKVLGESFLLYFGMHDGSFAEQIQKKGISQRIAKIIKKQNPSKIFTHAVDDPHPDHRAVHRAVLEAVDSLQKKYHVYTFMVWNPLKIKNRNAPKLVVDISKTFSVKVRAFLLHRSQKIAIYALLWKVFMNNLANGWFNHCRYAEVFYKIR